ncbi:hypothetical protein ACHAWT_008016 [Skeletonema menzelii]
MEEPNKGDSYGPPMSTEQKSAAASPLSLNAQEDYHSQSRPYKGFSTPFCGLFQTSGGLPTAYINVEARRDKSPLQVEHEQNQHDLQTSHLRTDICSLACFGVCQSDQTRYLFTHMRPPSFFKRITYHLFIPASIFVLAGWCSGNIRNEYTNKVICALLIYAIFVWYMIACFNGRRERIMVREEILWKLKRREEKIMRRQEEQRRSARGVLAGSGSDIGKCGGGGGGQFDIPYNIASVNTETEYEYYSDDDEEYHRNNYDLTLGQTRFEMNCAHRMCGCYPSDIAPATTPTHMDNVNNDSTESDYMLHQSNAASSNNNGDLCTRIWNAFSKPCLKCVPCCGSFGCHLQLCGFCALAQEAREANLILPRYMRMIDYITMEPFLLYYPRIVQLRTRNGSFWDHCNALSLLSRMILQTLAAVFVTMLGISLVNAIGYWNLIDMGVLGATFFQAFAVMYIVHWGWHRNDLSIDAVIKYFAAGFLLCTSMAFGVEMMEYSLFRLILMSVVSMLGVEQVEDNVYGGSILQSIGYPNFEDRYLQTTGVEESNNHARSLADDSDILQGFFDRQPIARIIYILVTAFLMTGLVEELCNYFGFVMVDHPDFCSEHELSKSKAMISTQLSESDDTEPSHDGEQEIPEAITSFEPSAQNRSLGSIRAGVTVAMVAVALGFSCCENILHIFVYNRSSFQSQITTLIAKSLFPVHPIAAAIQSIYVCRRDLEKDTSIGLGRVVLPSVLFHGTYDFAQLLISDSWKRSQASQYFYSGDNQYRETVMILCISFAIILCGGLFYILQSRRQYDRLDQLSRSSGSTCEVKTS